MNQKIKKKSLFNDEKGQLNLIGNLISFIQTQPWIIALLFIAGIYASTFVISFDNPFDEDNPFNFEPRTIINNLLSGVFKSFGFNFDWGLIVVIIFLAIPVTFIMKYGFPKG